MALWLPLSLFCLGFFLALWRPFAAFLVALALTPWLEVPTLQLGLENQFIVEYCWLGVLLASLLKRDFNKSLPGHPMLLPCLAAAVFTFTKYIPQMLELWSVSPQGLSLRKLAKGFWDGIFVWDIIHNPFHDISVVIGYLLFIGIVMLAAQHLQRDPQRLKTMLLVLLAASIPVHALGFLQSWTKLASSFGTVRVGATFQNENHYSFYSGLLILISIYLILSLVKWRIRLLAILVACFSVVGLLIGRGRSAWIAIVISLGLSLFLALMHQLIVRRQVRQVLNLKVVIPTLGLISGLAYGAWHLFHQLINRRELKIFDKLDLDFILAKSGRKHLFQSAWESIQTHPILGLGQGYFFNKSQTRYEIHNIWVDWTVGFGLWINIVILAALIPALWSFVRKSLDRKMESSFFFLGIGMLVYLAICSMPDIYFSFRPLLILSGILLLLVFKDNKPYSKKFILSFGFILPVLLGLASCFSPHTRFNVDKVWATEQSEALEGGNYTWGSLARWVPAKADQCLVVDLMPVFPDGSMAMQYKTMPAEERLSRFANLTEYRKEFEGNKNIFQLAAARWQKICFCPRRGFSQQSSEKSENLLLLFADKGEYLHMSKYDFGYDRRFISFGMSEPRYSEPGQDMAGCEQVLEI